MMTCNMLMWNIIKDNIWAKDCIVKHTYIGENKPVKMLTFYFTLYEIE